MSISSGVMSKNDLDMLLLGMPVGELILLQLGLSSNPQGANNLEIDVVGYAKSISGLSNEAAYNLLSDAAKSLFHRHFSYKITDVFVSSIISYFKSFVQFSSRLHFSRFNHLRR